MTSDGDFRVTFHHTDERPPENAILISEERQAQLEQILRDTEYDEEERQEQIKSWAFAVWATNLMPPD